MKELEVKKLWGKSGGVCAMDSCSTKLIQEGVSGVIGEMAHISAKSEGGPRWNPELSADERDGEPNLILLCPTHHTIIDTAVEEWPVERLQRMKSEHERSIASSEISEFSGSVDVTAEDGDKVTGVSVTRPTRIKSGTSITVNTKNVRETTGLRIGRDEDDV